MKKKMACGAALAAVILLAAWMWWPRSLVKAFDAEQQLRVSVVASGIKDGELLMDTDEQYDLEHGSAALSEVLKEYSCHPCLATLFGDGSIDLKGGTGETVNLYNAEGQCLISGGTAQIILDGRVYRVGYWGKSRGAALNRDILAALRQP